MAQPATPWPIGHLHTPETLTHPHDPHFPPPLDPLRSLSLARSRFWIEPRPTVAPHPATTSLEPPRRRSSSSSSSPPDPLSPMPAPNPTPPSRLASSPTCSSTDLDAAGPRHRRSCLAERPCRPPLRLLLAGPPPLRRRRPRPPPQRLHRASPTLVSATPVRPRPPSPCTLLPHFDIAVSAVLHLRAPVLACGLAGPRACAPTP